MGLVQHLPSHDLEKDCWPWSLETNSDIYDAANEWPSISIVTPSLNQGRYIEETIRSVLLQNYPNIEYIIIDGGSCDNTIKILEKYDKWITYWTSEKDKGQSHAINKGLKKCSGKIFNWLNSDDFLESKALYHVATAFMKNESALVVCGKEKSILSDYSVSEIHRGTCHKNSLEETFFYGHIDQPPTYFKKNCFDSIGYLNENLHYMMDSEWWCRFLCKYGLEGFIKIGDILTNFRLHRQSKSRDYNTPNRAFEIDRNTIQCSILKSLKNPSWLFKHFEKKNRVFDYNNSWDFTLFNKSKLLDLFAQRMVHDLRKSSRTVKAVRPKVYSIYKQLESKLLLS